MKLVKSKLLSEKFEETIILNSLRPVSTLANETWLLTEGNIKKIIIIFKRNVLINMCGPSYNSQLLHIYKRKKIIEAV